MTDSNLKEDQIRPQHLTGELDLLIEQDQQALLKHCDQFVSVPCPACESHTYAPEFEKNGFQFVRCGDCQTLYVSPRPTAAMLGEYYANARSISYWNDKIFPASEDARRGRIFQPRAARVVELCRKHGAATGTLVDVGAGFGTFCEEVQKLGAFRRVIALEPAKNLAASCRRRGVEVVEDSIERAGLEPADVITNFELIEHLSAPREFLMACAKALSPKGLLILTTPNVMGFDLLTLGKLSENVAGPNHINYFHPRSLTYLLQRCGFEVSEISTPGELDAELVRKSILAGELDISGQPFLKQVLVDQWETHGLPFQRFLSENTLSSHLWLVARKTTLL